VVDHTATARIQRLVRWLEQFKRCFGHPAQLLSLRTYVQGVFSDSERKSMQAMLARVTEPVAYQAFQHFITHAPWDADRVWRVGRLAPEVWLLCEREADGDFKYYLVDLPPGMGLRRLVELAHQRWAIEQQYQELKSELGLDHFEGRTYPGWQHHVVLTAVAHAYIQRERMRRGATGLTFPQVRAIVQEIFTALLFAAEPRYMQWMEQAKHELQLRI
jgi:SRSO17 transposase